MTKEEISYWWDFEGKGKKMHVIVESTGKPSVIARFYKAKKEPTFERQINLAQQTVDVLEKGG